MTNRSRSTLFLIEQLIVIAVFAICAVACISILSTAFFYANDSKATGHALFAAESGAEVFKATGGDFVEVADILGGVTKSGEPGTAVVTVYYDNTWQVCDEANAGFILNIVANAPQNPHDFTLVTGEITVEKITGEQLIAFPLAARAKEVGLSE